MATAPCGDADWVDPGPGVDDLADALAALPVWESTPPVARTIDGHEGVYMELNVPADVPAECQGGELLSYRDHEGGTQGIDLGKTQRLWIADVDGHRLMLVAGYFPGPEGPTPEQVDEMTRMAEGSDLRRRHPARALTMKPGDEERFAEFVRAHTASLFRTAYLMTGDYQRAEDVLQAALVRVYQHWPRVDAMDQPVGYARKVVVNQSVSWWRKRSSHESPLTVADEPAWDGRMDDVAEHERVWNAVLSLPRRQRAVTVLRYYEDMSEAQIAETLGDGSRHGQEPQPRSGPPAGRAARRTGARLGRAGPARRGGNVMTFDERLTRSARAVVDGLTPPAVDFDAIRARARSNRRRTAFLATGVTVAAMVAVGATVVAGRDTASHGSDAAGPDPGAGNPTRGRDGRNRAHPRALRLRVRQRAGRRTRGPGRRARRL